MARERFVPIKIENPSSYSPEFVCNFQTALLLSLLDKGLLTQSLFEACEQEIQRQLPLSTS